MEAQLQERLGLLFLDEAVVVGTNRARYDFPLEACMKDIARDGERDLKGVFHVAVVSHDVVVGAFTSILWREEGKKYLSPDTFLFKFQEGVEDTTYKPEETPRVIYKSNGVQIDHALRINPTERNVVTNLCPRFGLTDQPLLPDRRTELTAYYLFEVRDLVPFDERLDEEGERRTLAGLRDGLSAEKFPVLQERPGNILLIGPSGAGKNTFVNLCATATAGERKVAMESPSDTLHCARLTGAPLQIWTARGCDLGGTETDAQFLLMAGVLVNGLAPKNALLTSEEVVRLNSMRRPPMGSDCRKPHCIVFFGDAASIPLWEGAAKEVYRTYGSKTPMFVILSKCDEIVKGAGSAVFRSQGIKLAARRVQRAIGLPEDHLILMQNDFASALGCSSYCQRLALGTLTHIMPFIVCKAEKERVRAAEPKSPTT